MKNLRAISYWIGKGWKHQYSLVFLDGSTVDVPIESWAAAQPALERALEPECIGFVSSAQIDFGKRWVGEIWGASVGIMSNIYVPMPQDSKEEAAKTVIKLYDELKAEQEHEESDPVYALEKKLKSHDWYSHYSDDPRVVTNGEWSWREIKALMEKVDPKVAQDLLAKYKPTH